MKNKIKLIGVELEGLWYNKPYNYTSDSSVDFGYDEDYDSDTWIGESRSDPFDDINKLSDWIRENYPCDVNDTCGLHVHVSVHNKLDYSRLLDKKFFDLIYDTLQKFGEENNIRQPEFWDRLSGNNDHCPKIRYMYSNIWREVCYRTAINAYAYHAHGTLEIRVLPMFNGSEIAVKAVSLIYNTINSYLLSCKKEKKEKIVICV